MSLASFLSCESGAVTADYVVFTSAIAFSTVAAMDANFDAMQRQSDYIVGELNGSRIISSDFEG